MNEREYGWYDAVWLRKYVGAKAIIRRVRPGALASFEEALHVFRTSPAFQIRTFERVFDDETLGQIRRAVATLRPGDLEMHEVRRFGRFVVHDHPQFTELQQRTVSLVSDAVGEPVDPSYNFLSLYTSRGVVPPHMDSPKAKWTLDLCVNQRMPWAIHFSQVVPWPEDDPQAWRDPALRFTSVALEPGEAVLFSGSSQWHYREAMVDTGDRPSSDWLFFHFLPRGTAELVEPGNWARFFSIPELALDEPGIADQL